ncbi:MAG TPA: M23 family metallopeptidase [Kofleriaceae bacterium]|nr:M23 family metallopeptidase [Kofleriaceae bacterium]
MRAPLSIPLALDTLRDELAAPLASWQRGLGDVVHGMFDRLATMTVESGLTIPDVSMLTTEPVVDSESSGFGWRNDPIRHHRKFHAGADIRGKHGTPVVAAGDGVVVLAGNKNGYGNVIYVDHGGGVVTRYAHLSRIQVKVDDKVLAGQQIGKVGSTGRATGPHLHFEVRLEGQAVDPNNALAIAQLQRESPVSGRIAAFTLTPALQAEKLSNIDPPRGDRDARKHRDDDKRPSRPERPGRSKRVRPVS